MLCHVRQQGRTNTVSLKTQNSRKDDAKELIRLALSLVKTPASTAESLCMTYRIENLCLLPPSVLYSLPKNLKRISDYFRKQQTFPHKLQYLHTRLDGVIFQIILRNLIRGLGQSGI
jgi:hypothetical protein